ncbi:hypothetical protein Gohar_015581, partial [Gossypium harknessii]|nr:hypothetical protein [Gossypium harknessii]
QQRLPRLYATKAFHKISHKGFQGNLSCLAIWVCLNSASPKVLSYNTNAAHPSFTECSMAVVFPHNCLTGLRVYCPNGRHQIASICQDFKNECPRCSTRAETLIHALKDHLTTRTILAFSGLDNRLLIGKYSYCINWIEDIIRALDMKVVADFITTLWNSWINRNNFIFRGKEDDARVKPSCGFVKINFDVFVSNNKIGYSVIARDSDGFVLSAGGGFKNFEMIAEW